VHLKYKKKSRRVIYKTYATYIKRFYFNRKVIQIIPKYIYTRIYTPLKNEIATGVTVNVLMWKMYDFKFRVFKTNNYALLI
jgi:hypothetical protein